MKTKLRMFDTVNIHSLLFIPCRIFFLTYKTMKTYCILCKKDT